MVRISDTIIVETVVTLEKVYTVPRAEIRDAILPLLALPGIRLPGKRAYLRVLDLYVTRPSLSFADCHHADLVARLGLPAIVSFDRGVDRIPGIIREEP